MTEFDFEPVTSQVFLVSQIIVIVVAFFMVGLAVKAWKNTGMKKMVFLIIAFGLFALIHIVNYTDQALVNFMPDDARYAMFAATEICIMMMFVLAVIKK